jgi:hypothetical protein
MSFVDDIVVTEKLKNNVSCKVGKSKGTELMFIGRGKIGLAPKAVQAGFFLWSSGNSSYRLVSLLHER